MIESPKDTEEGQRRVVSLDERRLLLRYREGDEAAFAELVAAYRAPVYSYLCRCGIPRPDRDDLFQEVFLRLHRAAGSYDESRPLHPWIFTIVANLVRNHHRRRRVRELVFSQPTAVEPSDPAPDGERRLAAKETLSWLQERLARLPLNQRQVILLAGVEHLPLKAIAAALEMPINTVKSSLRRARLALVRDLARRQDGTEPAP